MTREYSFSEEQLNLAVKFRSLHKFGTFFVLPNAYDVPSARVFEEVGFQSVATSSAGMLISLGYPDGESMPKEEFLAVVRRMSNALSIPLSVDLVSGFGKSTNEVDDMVLEVLKAGAVGINIEDMDHGRNRLFEIRSQADKIRSIREMGDSTGIPLVINARTDAIAHGSGDFASNFADALERSERFIEAGADCVYPMGLTGHDHVKEFVKEVKFPVNVMVRKGLPSIKDLKQIGVTRLSFGPGSSYATLGLLNRIGRNILENEDFGDLLDDTIDFQKLNSLAVKKKK